MDLSCIYNKFKDLLKNNKFQLYLLVFISILGLYLRLKGLNKPNGLWYDEAWSYYEAKQSFPFGIINVLLTKDVHAPLYFIILHFWMKILGTFDTSLRFLSVIFGTLTIPVIYYAGKELSGKKVGFIAALFMSINSIMIYYSQEVRFYSLVVLLTSLSVLFLARIRHNPNRFNYCGLILSNIGIIYTFTIGFVFVFFEVLGFLLYLYFTNKKQPCDKNETQSYSNIKNFISAQIITFILSIPFIIMIFNILGAAEETFINSFDINFFSLASILTVFQNWFSPNIGGLINVVPDRYENIFSIDHSFVIFVVVPVIICILGIIKAILKKNIISLVTLIGIAVFLTEIIATILGKFTILTRYTIFILPIFLLAACYGLISIKNRLISILLIIIFIFTNLFYLLSNSESAPNYPRPEGFKIVAKVLKACSLTKNDVVFMPIGSMFLYQYYPTDKAKVIPFEVCDLTTKKANNIFFDEKLVNSLTIKNSYSKLRGFLASSQTSKSLEKYLCKNVFDKLEKDRLFVLVLTRDFALYSETMLKEITQDNELYKKQPLSLMVVSKFANDSVKISQKHLSTVLYIKADKWNIYIFKKIRQTPSYTIPKKFS